MNVKLNVLAISHGRDLFEVDGINRARMIACSEALSSHHIIIFSRQKDGLVTEQISKNLTLYPTSAKTGPGMVIKAITIGLSILRRPNGSWIITAQDPFEAGLIGFILRLRTKVPFNVQVHADFFSHSYWRREKLLNRVRYLFGIWLLRRADSVRVVSDRIAKNILRMGVPTNHLHKLPVLINVSDFTPTTDRQFNGEIINIISVARFVPVKNLPLLIKAFSLAVTQMSNLRLTLVGSGPERDRLLKIIQSSNNQGIITVLPWSSDVPKLLSQADIYALSSDYEGWARVLIEAMAAGLPIVTTEVGCVGEICKQDIHALVTSPRDLNAFAEALVTLAKDTKLRQRFYKASVQTTQTISQNLPDYITAWSNILNKTLTRPK